MFWSRFFSSAALSILGYTFGIIVLIYISRILGVSKYGQISFVLSCVSYFSMIGQMGFPLYAQCLSAYPEFYKSHLENSPDYYKKLRDILFITVVLGICSYLFMLAVVYSVSRLREFHILFLILGCVTVLTSFQANWYYRGKGLWKYLLIVTFCWYILELLAIFLFVNGPDDLRLYAFLSVVPAVGIAFVNYIRLPFSLFKPCGRLSLFNHFRASIRFFLMSCMVNIYSSLDIVMLGFMKTDETVGYYSIASKIRMVLTTVGGIIWNVNLTEAVRLHETKNKAGFALLLTNAMNLVMFFQIPVLIFSLYYKDCYVRMIAGSGYDGAIIPLTILLFVIPSVAISNILGGQALIPSHQENKLLLAESCGTVVNLLLNFLLIPYFSLNGAAFATVVAELVVAMLTVYYVRKNFAVRLFDFKYYLKLAMLSLFSLLVCVPCSEIVEDYTNSLYFSFFVGAFIFAGTFFSIYFSKRIVKSVLTILVYYVKNLHKIVLRKKTPYFCPCCSHHLYAFNLAKFIEHPDKFNKTRYESIDQHLVCPFCGSIPRHRIISVWIENNQSLLRNTKILYFAPEKSVMVCMKRNKIKVTTADLFQKADLKIDITHMPIPDNSYDFVFCNHVLEHVSDYNKALFELKRILKQNGKLIICFPIDSNLLTIHEEPTASCEERIIKFGQYDHLRVFGQDCDKILAEAGFMVDVMNLDKVPQECLPVVGPADYDSNRIFVCTKNV